MRASALSSGTEFGLDLSTIGDIEVSGLSITGTANRVTAPDFNGKGKAQEGYFAALHFDNAQSFKTARTRGKKLDADGNLLLLLGADSPDCKWIEVTDTDGKSDRFDIGVAAAG